MKVRCNSCSERVGDWICSSCGGSGYVESKQDSPSMVQKIRNDMTQVRLAGSQRDREETTAKFILECAVMANTLNRLCDIRKELPKQNIIDEHIECIHAKICERFNDRFGRPLFYSLPPYQSETNAD